MSTPLRSKALRFTITRGPRIVTKYMYAKMMIVWGTGEDISNQVSVRGSVTKKRSVVLRYNKTLYRKKPKFTTLSAETHLLSGKNHKWPLSQETSFSSRFLFSSPGREKTKVRKPVWTELEFGYSQNYSIIQLRRNGALLNNSID